MPFFFIIILITLYAIYFVEKECPKTVADAKKYFGLTTVPMYLIYILAMFPVFQMIILIFYIFCMLFDKGIFNAK